MRFVARRGRLVSSRYFLQVTIARPDYYGAGNHEAASKFLGQENFSAKYSAASTG
jgi:hypothetical protein